jgi:Pyruvate/2-oxoacid:ferredoxin oxidoreductase gamma subunit
MFHPQLINAFMLGVFVGVVGFATLLALFSKLITTNGNKRVIDRN